MSDRDALRDELDFLLASIDDLERERSAGDVDADDHRRLLDGYTARAARISRLLDGSEVEVTSPETPSAGPRRRPTTGVLGILVTLLLTLLLPALGSLRRPNVWWAPAAATVIAVAALAGQVVALVRAAGKLHAPADQVLDGGRTVFHHHGDDLFVR